MRFPRSAIYVVLFTLILTLIIPTLVTAQDDDAARVEQSALAAHLQNMRTHSFTAWIGGRLGEVANSEIPTPVGDTFTNWTLSGQAGDADFAFTDLARPTMLNFWASWCGPCQLEFPHVVGAALEPDAHSFDIVLVNTWDQPDDAEAYLRDYPAELVTVLDDGDKFARRVLLNSIPTSMLLDTDGTVLAVHIGIMTPTILAFFDAVAAQPGVGSFVAADYADVVAHAVLAPVSLANADPIAFSAAVQGTIDTENTQDAYQFEGRAGDTISIHQTATPGSDLDSYVVLLDATGAPLAENDDIEAGVVQDSQLDFTLPADGYYIVVATRFLEGDGFSEGRYELVVETDAPPVSAEAPAEPPAAPPAQPGDVDLVYGDTATGLISHGKFAEQWTFYGTAGDTITAIMSRTEDVPGGLDGYLILRGPDDTILLEVDDANDNLMPAIEGYVLPTTGVYTLVATRFGGESGYSTGEYALTLHDAASLAAAAAAPPEPPAATTAPTADLVYGDTVSGMISNTEPAQEWTFYGTAGDVITIVMTRSEDVPGDLDGYLILRDPAGNVLIENDDGPGSIMPALENYVLPETGVYTLVATRFGITDGLSTGEYTLALQAAGTSPAEPSGSATSPPAEPPAAAPAGTPGTQADINIAYGDTVTGTISNTEFEQRWVFAGSAGDVITATMTRDADIVGGLDGYLQLLGPEGALLLEVDDAAGSVMPAIADFALPQTGVYTLIATRFGGATGFSAGAYTLELTADTTAAVVPPSTPTEPAEPVAPVEPTEPAADVEITITYGETVTGTITNIESEQRWTFYGTAGDAITATMTRDADIVGGLDGYLKLLGPDGALLLEVDDAAGSVMPAMADFALPQTGVYTLIATRFGGATGFSEGAYTLELTADTTAAAVPPTEPTEPVVPVEPVEPAAPPADVEVTITYGETVTGTISNTEPEQTWTFYGTAGDAITATMTRDADIVGGLDGYLKLLGPDGALLLEVDDAAGSVMPAIADFTLPQTGVYTLVATRFGGATGFSEGAYTLELVANTTTVAVPPSTPTAPVEPTPPADVEVSLAYGDIVNGTITDTEFEQRWTFYGFAGDAITAIMDRTDDDPGGLDGYLILRGPDDQILLEIDDAPDSVMPTIDSYVLSETGVYTLVATRFGFANGYSSGDYTLELRRIQEAAAVGQPITTSGLTTGPIVRWLTAGELPSNLHWITYNNMLEDSLSADALDDWYIFNGAEGDIITISMAASSGDLDPFLLLMDENGFELARNDDATAATTDAQITEFALPINGSYLIRATRYGLENGPTTGAYTLVIETDAAGVGLDASALEPVDLALATPLSGTLDLNNPHVRYTFEAEAGDWFTASIARTSGSLDPALTLYDADGNQLASNRTWLGDATARITRFELPAAGTYYLDVQLDNLGTSGDYQLYALVTTPPAALDPGAFVPAADQDLEIVLIWGSTADLDLSVSGPAEPTTDAAFANDFCTDTVALPVEQLTWAAGSAVAGNYTVTVTYQLDCTGTPEGVDFILVIAQHSEVIDLIGGTVARAGDQYSTTVTFAP